MHDDDVVAVSTEAIDVAALLASVQADSCGAVVLFLGTVRDHSPGKDAVSHLEYEAYEELVEVKIAGIIDEVRSRWPVRRVAAVHRLGSLQVGQISVAVAVCSPHRDDAFPAARYLIDELKTRAPIWKKEHWAGGAEWVEGA